MDRSLVGGREGGGLASVLDSVLDWQFSWGVGTAIVPGGGGPSGYAFKGLSINLLLPLNFQISPQQNQ